MAAHPVDREPAGVTLNQRRRQIAAALARQGLGKLLSMTGLDRTIPRRLKHDTDAAPQALRAALEELGPTFIKLGQIVSTRADLLGREYRDELAKLQDGAPPIQGDEAWAVVDAELGGKAEAAFASFDREPLASASIGQAHVATLPDGTEVVVKVRRPGAAELIELDLRILQECAADAVRRWETAARLDVVNLLDEFARLLREELDYVAEGRNAERMAANFAGDPDVQIPRVFWDTTTSRIITLERLRGMKVTDVGALVAAGIDPHLLAERATRITAKMVFDDEFFHGDPHPGNFFVEQDGRIGLIDFGVVGTVDDRLRDELGKILVGIMRKDPRRVAESLVALGTTTGPIDRTELRDDIGELLARYAGLSLGEISLTAAIADFQEISRRHRLRLPSNLALLVKVLTMGEGMATDLDPEFQISDVLAPYARRSLLAELSPAALERRLEQLGVDAAELAVDFPGQIHRLLDVLGDGGFDLHLRAGELEPLLARMERLGNRIAASVLVSAVIDGLAELAAAGELRRTGWRRAWRALPVLTAAMAYVAWKN